MADRVRRDITRLAKRRGSKFVEAEPCPVGGCLVGEYDLVIQVHKVNRIVGPFGDPRDGASDGFEFGHIGLLGGRRPKPSVLSMPVGLCRGPTLVLVRALLLEASPVRL